MLEAVLQENATVKRLFVGTLLNPEQQSDLGELKQKQEQLFSFWQRKIRFVEAIKLHMTWMFLGDVETNKLPEIQERLLEICTTYDLTDLTQAQEKMTVTYSQVEFWPSSADVRQVVLTPQYVPETILKLGNIIRASLKDLALKADLNDFCPHITLMRLEPLVKPLTLPGWLEIDEYLPVIQEIDAMALIESHFGTARNDYELLAEFKLGKI